MVAARVLVAAVGLVAATLHGQEVRTVAVADPTVGGVIKDIGGIPVPDVEVGVVKGETLQQFVITGADGRFLLSGMKPGVVPLRIRRLGYEMRYLDIDARNPSAAALEIVLKSVANELEDVMIAANDEARLREFNEHKAQRGSFAKFYDQQEIRRRRIVHTSELFRSMPGITIKGSSSGGNTIRIRGCQPMVWIDGQRVPDAELDEVASPSDIAGIEFYSSTAGTPAQYMERSNRLCGTVLVWTRNR